MAEETARAYAYAHARENNDRSLRSDDADG